MANEFYWINTFNMVEFGGPFSTAEEARFDAVEAMMDVQGMALSIDIVQVIDKGQVSKSAGWLPRGAI